MNNGSTDTLDFLYDGSALLGWFDTGSQNSWNFVEAPGSGALAGSFTSAGTTTTWVPLIDPDGSTVALVNAASTLSPPATTYVYDPSGGTTVGGATNSWPFQYQGLEHEFTDPAQLYYSGGGQFYNPQIQRGLSETNATGISGAPSGPGPVSASPQSPAGGRNFNNLLRPGAGLADELLLQLGTAEAPAAVSNPYALAAVGLELLANLIEDLLNGPP